MDNYVGKRLDGRYEIQEIIGVGGMAVVYKAYDNIDDRVVAIKILKDEFLANEEFRRRFKNESKAIAVLSHPNIVKVYDVSFGDRLQYIVMEYIDGITLKEYIEQQKVIRPQEAVHFTIQILRALQHAHDKGIVHRDIKPQNIMLLQNGTIKVTDFGIARFSRSETRTITEKAIGSVHYISPEQARGEITDEKADIYSVGVMLYEMLTGALPFQADSAVSVAIMQMQADPKVPSQINGAIPMGLEQITMKAMQKKVADRYQTAAQMLKDLSEFKQNPDITFSYSYFVDKAPTKYVDPPRKTLNSEKSMAEMYADYETEEDEGTEKKSKVIPILTAIAIAFVVILVGLFIYIASARGGSNKLVDAPDLKGLTLTQAQEQYPDFDIQVDRREASSEYAVDTIISQDPGPDTKIKKTAIIKVVVSSGTEVVNVPNVVEQQFEAGKATLERAEFKVEMVESPSTDVPKGQIIKTVPEANTEAPKGSTISVYVSTGPLTEPVACPGLIGKTKDEAKTALEKVGLKLGTVTPKESDQKKDVVLEQDPAEKTELEKGDAVNIVVSSGVKPQNSVTLTVRLPAASGTGWMQVFLNNSAVDSLASSVLLQGGTKEIALTGNQDNVTVVVMVDSTTIYTSIVNFSDGKIRNEIFYEYVSVPDVVGLKKEAATNRIKAEGLQYQVTEINDTAPAGTVISTSPPAGTPLLKNETVTVTVSKGPSGNTP